ncbi:MAG: PAS domain S-box protein [Candidatus Glassbacteria bacterium]|nr:PAS domain S-box protein [Candidatus Glassbacteria bacterium]
MAKPLKVLIVEDSEGDARLLVRHLRRGGFDPVHERVETAEAMRAAFADKAWDVVLCDYKLPKFSPPAALALLRELDVDLPFIVVSGAVGEERAADLMKAGAHDLVLKDSLARLIPAIKREMLEAKTRRKGRRAEDALRESEERYRDLYENAPVAYASVSAVDGSILRFNRMALRLLGYDRDDLKRMNVSDLFADTSDGLAKAKFVYRNFQRGKSIRRAELQMKRKDGDLIWIGLSVEPVKDAEGNITESRSVFTDITDRRRAEAALRESEERWRGFADASFDGLLIHDSGVILDANERFAEMFGCAADELRGTRVLELVAPESLEMVRERLMWQVAEYYEAAGRRKDGSTFPMEVSSREIAYKGREQRAMAVRDITERMRADKALRESAAVLAASQQIGNLGSWEWNTTTDEGMWSDETFRIFGLAPDSPCPSFARFLEMVHPEDRDAVKKSVEEAVANRRPYEFEYRVIRPDGTCRACYSKAELILDDAGGVTGMVGIIQDITERKRAEEELRKLSRAVEQSPALVIITDTEGNIEYVNPKFEQITGYAAEEAIGKNPRILKSGHTPPEEYKRLWRTITSGGEWRGEFHNRKKNGELYWEAASISPITAPDGTITHFLAVKEDITERRRTQAQLIQSSKLATLGEMATGMAHELNQPLSVIRMAADSTLERLEDGDVGSEYLRRKLDRISAQIERAAGIIDHMRIFGRVADEKPQAFDPREVMENALGLMGQQLRLRSIEVETALPERCRSVSGHGAQLEQVVLNLLTNARDAIGSNRDSSADAGKIIIGVEDLGSENKLRLTVEDTGGGIPEDVIPRIFEPFYTTKEVGQGTGLGLSVSYGIVRDMGGTIEAANADGGARFTVTLPALEDDKKSGPKSKGSGRAGE